MLVVTALLCSCGSGSGGHEGEDPDGSAWEQPSDMPAEFENAIFGRLWVNPNPVIFGMYQGSPAREAVVNIANIGSEDVVIEKVILSGDPEIYNPGNELDSRYPNEMSGDERCGGISVTGFGLNFEPETDYSAQATVTVQTSDPTSPTLDVPIYVDRSVEFGELSLEPFAFSFPVVKPNPLRLEASTQSQQAELCLEVVGPGSSLRVTRLEVVGDGLSIGDITDDLGNAAPVPTPTDPAQAVYPSKAVVTYEPSSGGELDGALLVEFEDLTGSQKSLVVPILVR